jgi:hypothetical protein
MEPTFYGLVRRDHDPNAHEHFNVMEVWQPSYDPNDCTLPDADFVFGTSFDEAVVGLRGRYPTPDLSDVSVERVQCDPTKHRAWCKVLTHPTVINTTFTGKLPILQAYLKADPNRRLGISAFLCAHFFYDEGYVDSDLVLSADTLTVRYDPVCAKVRRTRRVRIRNKRVEDQKHRDNEHQKFRQLDNLLRALQSAISAAVQRTPPFGSAGYIVYAVWWRNVPDMIRAVQIILDHGNKKGTCLGDSALVAACRAIYEAARDDKSLLSEAWREEETKDPTLVAVHREIVAVTGSLVRRADRRRKLKAKQQDTAEVEVLA